MCQEGSRETTDLEALILEDLLDCNILIVLGHVEEAGSKYDAKGAIANDFAVCVRDLLLLAGFAVGSDDLDYPRGVICRWRNRGRNRSKRRGGRGNKGLGWLVEIAIGKEAKGRNADDLSLHR